MAKADATADDIRCDVFEDAYYAYRRDLEDIGHELTQSVMAAQNDGRTAQITRPLPDADHAADAARLAETYAAAVHAAWMRAQERYAAGYAAFLDAFSGALADAERGRIAPAALATLAQSLVTVAHAAAGTIGNTDVFFATGVAPPAATDDAPETESALA